MHEPISGPGMSRGNHSGPSWSSDQQVCFIRNLVENWFWNENASWAVTLQCLRSASHRPPVLGVVKRAGSLVGNQSLGAQPLISSWAIFCALDGPGQRAAAWKSLLPFPLFNVSPTQPDEKPGNLYFCVNCSAFTMLEKKKKKAGCALWHLNSSQRFACDPLGERRGSQPGISPRLCAAATVPTPRSGVCGLFSVF